MNILKFSPPTPNFPNIFVYLPIIVKTPTRKPMSFINLIKKLREEQQMPQRQLAVTLNIDTATYCKIEKGDRRAKREQVETIASVLNADKNVLLSQWLADQLLVILADEKAIAEMALEIAQQTLKQK